VVLSATSGKSNDAGQYRAIISDTNYLELCQRASLNAAHQRYHNNKALMRHGASLYLSSSAKKAARGMPSAPALARASMAYGDSVMALFHVARAAPRTQQRPRASAPIVAKNKRCWHSAELSYQIVKEERRKRRKTASLCHGWRARRARGTGSKRTGIIRLNLGGSYNGNISIASTRKP